MALGKQRVLGRLERRHALMGDLEKDMGWMSAWQHVIEDNGRLGRLNPP